MNFKWSKALLSATLSASLLAGCSGGSTTKKEDENVTVEFWTIDLKANFSDYFNGLIESYEKDNPNVKINWVDVPFADIQSKLVAAAAGGTAPDVVNLNTQMTLTLAGQDALVDLNKEASDEQKSIYIEDLWNSAKIGDSVYAFPWYASPDIMFYNKALFEQAGMEVPKTFDEALSMSKEFYEKTGAYIFLPDEFFNQLYEENLGVLSEDKTEAAFNNDKTVAQLEKYKKYSDEGYIPKTNWGDWAEALKLYESGKLAIISSSGSSAARIKDEAKNIYDTTAVSTPLTGSTGLSRNPLMNLTVPSSSKHVKEAIDFAAYVTNDENQLAFCKIVSIFPSTTKASQDEFFTSDTTTLEGQASAMSAKASQTSQDFSLGVANQSKIQDAVNKAYQAAIINGDDIKASLTQAETDVNNILKESD